MFGRAFGPGSRRRWRRSSVASIGGRRVKLSFCIERFTKLSQRRDVAKCEPLPTNEVHALRCGAAPRSWDITYVRPSGPP